MDLIKLKTEVQGDPAGVGYAAYLPDAPGKACEVLNAKTFSMRKTKMLCYKGLYSSYGIGPDLAPIVLGKIRAGAESSQVLYDIKMMIYSDAGLDFADGSTLYLIDQLTPTLFTLEEADALRAASMQPASRAEIVFGAGAVVTIEDLREAGVI